MIRDCCISKTKTGVALYSICARITSTLPRRQSRSTRFNVTTLVVTSTVRNALRTPLETPWPKCTTSSVLVLPTPPASVFTPALALLLCACVCVCVWSRRTSPTLPGTLLRLPQLGMPLPTSNPVDGSADQSRSAPNTQNDSNFDRDGRRTGAQTSSGVVGTDGRGVDIVRGGRTCTGEVEGSGPAARVRRCRASAVPNTENGGGRCSEDPVAKTSYGDLVVLVSVTLPSGEAFCTGEQGQSM